MNFIGLSSLSLNKITPAWVRKVHEEKAAQLGSSILFTALCAPLRPLPSASLWGVCVDMPLSGACTYGLCLTSKRGHKGSVLPLQLRSIRLTADSSMCVWMFMCVSLWLSLGPSSFHFRLLSILLSFFFFLFFGGKMDKGRREGITHSFCVGECDCVSFFDVW